MLIVCPNCATSYQVQPASLGAAGRSVRCARCKNTWYATNTAAMAAIAHAHRQDLADLNAPPTAAGPSARSIAPAPPAELPEIVDAPSIDPVVAEDAFAVAPEQPPYEEQPHGEPPAALAEAAPEPAVVEIEQASGPAPTAPDAGATAIGTAPPPLEDIESVAARRLRRQAARKRSRWLTSRLSVAILALICANIGLIAFRADIVRWFPQTASLYGRLGLTVNLRGLVFTDIVTRRDTQDGVSVLIVEGFIRNDTRDMAQVPRLRFAVRNDSGLEIYSWTAQPARNVIPAGSTLPFRSRLASPPSETHEVLVRFFNRRDLVAGVQ